MSCPFEILFGINDLLAKSGSGSVKVTDLSQNEVVGVYFSAHWCPPCRDLTPKLVQVYQRIREKGHKMEIIFVSADHDENGFQEHFNEMPWLALSYADRKRWVKLSIKYGVSKIPSLILLDSKGEIISKNGRSIVIQEEDEFPWPQPTFAELLGSSFASHGDTPLVGREAVENKFLCLYFSASWCSPCQIFSLLLTQTYAAVLGRRQDVEFIFVSSDRDEASFQAYWKRMPFLALPFAERSRIIKLSDMFGINGIPALVVVDPTGKLITTDARVAVESDPQGLEFPWYPKKVNDLDDASGINEKPSLVILADGESKETQEKLEAILFDVAEKEEAKAKGAGKDLEMLFFIGKNPYGGAKKIRAVTKIGDTTKQDESEKKVVCDGMASGHAPNTYLVLLDMLDSGAFYLQEGFPTSDSILTFLDSFRAGSLERHEISHEKD